MSDVPPFLWQSALFLLLAYFVGAWIGCMLRRLLTRSSKMAMAGSTATPATATAGRAVSRASGGEPTNRFGRALVDYPGEMVPPPAREAPAAADATRTVDQGAAYARQPEARPPEPASRPPADQPERSAAAPPPRPGEANVQGERTATGIAAAGAAAGTAALAAAARQRAGEEAAEPPARGAAPELPSALLLEPPRASHHEPARPFAMGRPENSLAARLDTIPQREQGRAAEPPARRPEEEAGPPVVPRPTDPERPAGTGTQAGTSAESRRDRPEAVAGQRTPSAPGTGGDGAGPQSSSDDRTQRAPSADREKSTGAMLAGDAAGAAAAATRAATTPSAPAARPAPAPTPSDNLLLIDGITAADAVMLKRAGITSFRQIAAWTRDDIDKLPDSLGGRRRISQENWIEQAGLLARGTPTAHIQRLRERSAAAGTASPVQPSARAAPQPPASPPVPPAASRPPTAAPTVTQAGAGANRQGDDLTRIDGIDAEAARILNARGVTRINQIASWSDSDALRADHLFGGSNRVRREDWVGQARRLAGPENPQAGARPPNIGKAAGGAAAAAAAASVARSSESGSRTARPVQTGEAPAGPQRPVQAGQATAAPQRPMQSSEAPASPHRPVQSGEAPASPQRPMQSGEAPAAPQRPVQSGEAPAAPQRPAQASGPASAEAPRAPATGMEYQPPMSPGERDPRAAAAATPASVEGLRSVRSQALLGGTTGGAQGANDLKRIRGVGVLLEKRLNMLGYTRYAQIAAWTQADIDRVNQQLDFSGRIERENWIEQARILATGGQTEFSRRQDRGGV